MENKLELTPGKIYWYVGTATESEWSRLVPGFCYSNVSTTPGNIGFGPMHTHVDNILDQPFMLISVIRDPGNENRIFLQILVEERIRWIYYNPTFIKIISLSEKVSK